jgi:hypothetical protein
VIGSRQGPERNRPGETCVFSLADEEPGPCAILFPTAASTSCSSTAGWPAECWFHERNTNVFYLMVWLGCLRQHPYTRHQAEIDSRAGR